MICGNDCMFGSRSVLTHLACWCALPERVDEAESLDEDLKLLGQKVGVPSAGEGINMEGCPMVAMAELGQMACFPSVLPYDLMLHLTICFILNLVVCVQMA